MISSQQLQQRLDAIEGETLDGLIGKSLLLTREWSRREIRTLCELAALLEVMDKAHTPCSLFANELHLALFFDSSTRTKSSWAGAAARLGAQPMIVDGGTTQVGHGETAKETGAMVGMNAHALGIRHDRIPGQGQPFLRQALEGIEEYLRNNDERRIVPMVNLQCDEDHPTQTLADLCWLQEVFGNELAGRTMAVTWAYSPSYAKPLSVPRGLLSLLPRFGMHLRLAHPPGYDLGAHCIEGARGLATEGEGSITLCPSMEEAFSGADAVYPKSWGPMDLMEARVEADRTGDEVEMLRLEEEALLRNAEHRQWIADESKMALTAAGEALYMHCLPADIGAEVSPTVLEASRFRLARQANKKLYVIMAALAAAKEPLLVERLRLSLV